MTAAVPHPDVVVVGAGPTGVAAAILLGQAGVRTLVLDRWRDVFAQPRAVHLDDEVYRILGRLGVAEAFGEVSVPGAGLRLLTPQHRTLAQLDRTRPETANGYPQATMFDQPDLERILRDRLAGLDPVTFVGGVEVEDVGLGPDRPEVTYRSTAGGDPVSVRPRFVLGCDGANSLVRRVAGGAMVDLGFAAQRWLVVDVATPRDLGHWGGVHQVCDSDRAATYMRIGPTRHRWEFELHDDESADDYATVERLAPLLAPWETRTDDLVLVRVAEYTFRAQVLDTWRRGPVLLLGDAAHLTPPFIGQGMGAGLRDAANLAWKLAHVLQGRLPQDALDTYEQERKPHATAMVRRAMLVGRAMTGGGRTGDWLRRVVLPLVTLVPGLRGRVLDSATPALRRSALNDRPRLGRSLAGTLCPNVVVPGAGRLDDVAAGEHLLVLRTPPAPGSTGPATGLRCVTGDDVPGLRSWLGSAEAALVRPDGTVQRVGSLASALRIAHWDVVAALM